MSEQGLTRMELIKSKQRLRLANKGYDLLKRKQDVLVKELIRMLKKSKQIREMVNKKSEICYKSLALVESYFSPFEIEELAIANKREVLIDLKVNNIMGVKIPDISLFYEKKKNISYPNSIMIRQCMQNYTEFLYLIIDLAKTEIAIRRLLSEIVRIKRKTNSLNLIIIPKIEERIKKIKYRLEELERDQFVKLKMFKTFKHV